MKAPSLINLNNTMFYHFDKVYYGRKHNFCDDYFHAQICWNKLGN